MNMLSLLYVIISGIALPVGGIQMQYLPFTARHVLSVNADVDYAGWSLDALWQMRSGRSDGYVDLPAWNTLDAALSKNFSLGKFHVLGFKVMVKNILDCRYETVSGYPMPGRSFMGGVEYKF